MEVIFCCSGIYNAVKRYKLGLYDTVRLGELVAQYCPFCGEDVVVSTTRFGIAGGVLSS